MSEPYLIWSNEHRAWWRGNRHGYTRGLYAAGQFSRAEALKICADAVPQAMHVGAIAEIPARLADVEEFLQQRTTLPKEITEDTGFV
jgi:hypothetical protein